MRRPSKKILKELRNSTDEPSLSVYIPMQESISTGMRNPNEIRLKKAINEARSQLKEAGVDKKEIDTLLHPLDLLQKNPQFANLFGGSIAIFSNMEIEYILKLKGTFDELVHVGSEFKLDDIKQEIRNNKEFLLINVSLNGNDLFQGDMYQLERLHVEKLGLSMQEALKLDEVQKQHQTHTVGRGRQGKNTQAMHGHGEPNSSQEELTREYLRHVESIVTPVARQARIPLLFAGLKEYFPIYKRINGYTKLIEESVQVNIRHDGLNKLHKKAWGVISQQQTSAS